jgi:hypothetical protein
MVRVGLLLLAGVCVGAHDPNVPHMHNGAFKKYSTGPPNKAGFRLTAAEIARITSGNQAECSVIALPVSKSSPKGTMRCTSVQEIKAPPEVVWKLLLDFPRYPKFVGGIASCEPYKKHRTLTGGKMIWARYTAAVGPFKLRYYLEHQYEPLQHCMVWTLDYSRRSDIFDSVGYWYIEQRPTGSRVYYTQDTLLPSWIPSSLRKKFTQAAMHAATARLEPACLDELRARDKRQRGLLMLPQLPKLQMPQLPKLQMPELPKLQLQMPQMLRSRSAVADATSEAK